MADRDGDDGLGVLVGALAGTALVALTVLFAKEELTGRSGISSAAGVSGLSTMAGVEAHDADHSASGVQLAPRGVAGILAEVDIAPLGEPMVQLYFALGRSALPDDAGRQFATVIDEVRARPGSVVLVSGYHDASGSDEANARISLRRAQAVAAALGALGVPLDRLLLQRQRSTLGNGDADEARRVEVRVQAR